ncbi:putative membrane protein [Anoxybacillus sp. B7M1]|jgi:hypothetical protein|uniref:LiaI-LiaF-like domain-containing protein n=1 Tax=unclassified Anoxybacillus TaxID=2639704 RepID=UPI0005CCEBCE|nr:MULTISPECIES: DUF5668 domain-containing protein [unclassified Anoxybacillus]ANB56036.1 putative membrane protein [Anoxybacillus sp. B2M1]ANB64461.1 putative membrane protein [Anoxybacillus sp. B7M1]
MKKHGIFSGIVLVGLGIYFLGGQLQLAFLKVFQGWPALLVIFGMALLGQAYYAREYQHIFPGTVLLGFGLHFLLSQLLPIWPKHIGVLFLITSLAFFLSARKTKTGFVQSLLFFILACFMLFSDRFSDFFLLFQTSISSIWRFWPLLLILFGLYILFVKKK